MSIAYSRRQQDIAGKFLFIHQVDVVIAWPCKVSMASCKAHVILQRGMTRLYGPCVLFRYPDQE